MIERRTALASFAACLIPKPIVRAYEALTVALARKPSPRTIPGNVIYWVGPSEEIPSGWSQEVVE